MEDHGRIPVQQSSIELDTLSNLSKDAANNKSSRSKRRSKKDAEGWNYKCPLCDKTYLSYPALYTHNKLKHSNENGGKPLSISNGRGRGRPRKNVPLPFSNLQSIKKYNPESKDYLLTEDKRGGPVDPIIAFETAFWAAYPEKEVENHPLYGYLLNFSRIDGFCDDEVPGRTKEQYDSLTEEDKRTMICDEVFALFIWELCKQINKHFAAVLCSFVLLYRDVTNESTWTYTEEEDPKPVDKENYKKEYTELFNADLVPWVCNDLIASKFEDPDKCNDFDLEWDHCIDFTVVILKWLYEEGFTDWKVTLRTN